MGATRWAVGVVGVVAAVAVLAGCDTPPAPASAPGPTGAARPAGPSRPPADRPPGAAAPGPAAPSAAADEPCPAGGVRVRQGGGDSAMGVRIMSIELVNCSAEPYVLEGHPQIRLLDRKRAPLEAEVLHGSGGIAGGVPNMDRPAERVTLEPGRTAAFGMLWRNLVTDPSVPAAEGWAVEVTPRPGAPVVTAELTHSVDLGNTGRLGISAWSAATR
ncbi:DUF4232 domain-containing protein [Streptomyces sp. NPDC007369]|uniref:DUF4232 domain-containing protein n=1 Tax=Streptomyces sp. NPDC007369 TaxID=3154589 RepID=UPI0033D6BA34